MSLILSLIFRQFFLAYAINSLKHVAVGRYYTDCLNDFWPETNCMIILDSKNAFFIKLSN